MLFTKLSKRHFYMQQKTILITGCSSGIGHCAAESLRERGYHVFATARKEKDVLMLQRQGFESLKLDVSDSQSIHTAVNDILNRTEGTLYALFNNAGYAQPGAVEDLDRHLLRQQFETNVFGLQELTNLIIPVMRRQGFGRIINVSSVLGFIAYPYRGAYVASKYAVEGLTDTLRLELRNTSIFVSLIEPGPIISQFRSNVLQHYLKNIDATRSSHQQHYQNALDVFEKKLEKPIPFSKPPNAVVKKLIHALESRKPKGRYYVTFPTILFAILKRGLSTRMMDWVLAKITSREV